MSTCKISLGFRKGYNTQHCQLEWESCYDKGKNFGTILSDFF